MLPGNIFFSGASPAAAGGGGGGGGTFTDPFSVAGMALWLNVTNSTPHVESSAVTSVTDASGNGFTYFAGTTGPSWNGNISGRQALTFNQVGYLTNNTFQVLLNGTGKPFSVFVVGNGWNTAGSAFTTGSTTGNGAMMVASSGTAYRSFIRDDSAVAADNSGGTVDINWHTVAVVYNGSTVSAWVDATNQVINAAAASVGAETCNVSYWGARNLAGTLGSIMNNSMRQVIVYTNAVSNVNQTNISQWLVSNAM